jgi:hypothetical protein
MKAASDRALEFVRHQALDVPGILGRDVTDWHIVDSTTIRLDDSLKHVFPGAGDYAAAKVHKRFSVGRGTLFDYSISPARDHDAPGCPPSAGILSIWVQILHCGSFANDRAAAFASWV